MKEGIERVDHDKEQPYRVWWKNRVIWFGRTLLESDRKLQHEKNLSKIHKKQEEK